MQLWSEVSTTREVSTFGHCLATVSRLAIILAGGTLSVPGTSSAAVTRAWGSPYAYQHDVTTGAGCLGVPALQRKDAEGRLGEADHAEATRSAVNELRLISGLTWDELGQLLGVSRRSLHFWASGKPLSAQNEERVTRLLAVVRFIDRGNARNNRKALLGAESGETAFNLLAAQRFEEVCALLGPGARRPAPARAPLSPEAKAARLPLSPETLVDAENDPAHRGSGRVRIARTVRVPRRGTT